MSSKKKREELFTGDVKIKIVLKEAMYPKTLFLAVWTEG